MPNPCSYHPDTPAVQIAGREVGPGRPVLIVAEAGVNHDGRLDDALKLVDAASEAGADGVKVQVFDAHELTTATTPTAPYQEAYTRTRTQRELLVRLELSAEQLERIKARCAERNLLFFGTPFGIPQVETLVAREAAAIKIASTDLTHIPLLFAASKSRLPLIVSTGASTPAEIDRAVEVLRAGGAFGRLILLHCISAYPAPEGALNLRAIGALAARYHLPVGFSDHSRSRSSGAWAVACGACVLEKHLTLDRGRPGPDHAISLDPAEFASYAAQTRAVEQALGSGRIGYHECEAEVRRVGRRSVVAATFVPAGTTIDTRMLALKRPGGGLEPSDLASLSGKTAAVDIPEDTVLAWDMVQ